MFNGQRQFKALILTAPGVSEIQEVMEPLDDAVNVKEFKVVEPESKSLTAYHGFYYSKLAFVDPDLLGEFRVRRLGQYFYKYDFFIAKWVPKRRPIFVIAVPVPAMASVVFNCFKDLPNRKFKATDLHKLIKSLTENSELSTQIVATSARFNVSGGGGANSTQITGGDVLGSKFYKRTAKSLNGIELVPLKMRLRFDDGLTKFSFETDQLGNYWFRISKNGLNLPVLEQVLGTLHRANVLGDSSLFPLQSGE